MPGVVRKLSKNPETNTMDPRNFSECWNDDERMNFLFSAFPPSRTVNPHHWDTKLHFWTKLIRDMCLANPYGYISWDNLFSKLTRHGRHPLGLQVVFDELMMKGDLVPTAEYIRDIHANDSWVGWGLNWVVKKPVSWMADKVLSPIKSRPGRDMKAGQFVMVPALKEKCDQVITKYYDTMSLRKVHDEGVHILNIVPYSELQELAKDIVIDAESLDLVLATLKKDKKVEITVIADNKEKNGSVSTPNNLPSGEKYVKFAKKSEKRVAPISESDIGIIQLCRTRTFLEKQIENAYKEMEQCKSKARECVKNGQRMLAKNALRKRKRLETSLGNKEKTLSNIEELLESIHQCKTDKMVMETYKSGVSAYKDISKGLDEDSVRGTMDDLASVFDTQSDISEALSNPISSDNTDNIDLEAELEALLSDKNENLDDLCDKFGSVNIKGLELPDVPEHSPQRSSKISRDSQEISKQILYEN